MSNKKVEAKNDFVIIRVERPASSGITLLKPNLHADVDKDAWVKTMPLMVISIGPKVKNIKVGDRILPGSVTKYAYLTEILGDKNSENIIYFAAREQEIVAVIN